MSRRIIQLVHQGIFSSKGPRLWTQAHKRPEDYDSKDITNVNEDIESDNEKSELDLEPPDTTKYSTQHLLPAGRYKE